MAVINFTNMFNDVSKFQPKETPYRPLNALLQQIKAVQKPHSETILTKNIKLKYLVPYDIEIFYTYQGSLTTPPCSEAVTWIIFPDPILCAFDQVMKNSSVIVIKLIV